MRSALVCVFLAGCGGCAESHVRPDGGPPDAGTRDAPAIDRAVMRWDSGARMPDGDLPDGTDCSEVAGYRRCGLDQCPYRCPGSAPERCHSQVPLCITQIDDDVCHYEVGEFMSIPDPCDGGGPCLFVGEPPPELGQWGSCLDNVALCLTDYEEARLPAYHCRWTDMTVVTRAPPAATCPPPADPRAPFCAGACGDAACPELRYSQCIGLSDTRGFGVCSSTLPCYESMPTELRAFWNMCNDDPARRPCACMVALPQPEEAPFPRGVLASESACRAYRDAYPTGVECRDIDWNPIP